MIAAAPLILQRRAPPLYQRWRVPMMAAARLALVLCPATQSLYTELAAQTLSRSHLGFTMRPGTASLLAIIIVGRLSMLLIGVFCFCTDILTHLIVQALAIALDLRAHVQCCDLPLYQEDEAKRVVHILQMVLLALGAVEVKPLNSGYIRDPDMACKAVLSCLHWYLGWLLPTYIVIVSGA
ncbi:hypothetical protein N2152v2_006326 [Parachlorella kessleri]